MPSCFRSLVDHDRHTRRAFFNRRTCAIPRKGPAPVHADFVVRIDHVFRAKLMSKHFGAVLRNRDCEVLSSPRPISVTNPQPVFAATWNLEILIQHGARLISARGRGVPFALTTLRPLR